MVIISPLTIGLWDPFQMAFLWLINGGDPNYLLTGMILQVGFLISRCGVVIPLILPNVPQSFPRNP